MWTCRDVPRHKPSAKPKTFEQRGPQKGVQTRLGGDPFGKIRIGARVLNLPRSVASPAPADVQPVEHHAALCAVGRTHQSGRCDACPTVGDRCLLETSRRAGVWPDSVQVLGGTLALRLPARSRVWLYSGLRTAGHRGAVWLKRGVPGSQ